jgi:lipopolysaccharide biosynthesis glycosyltransferase
VVEREMSEQTSLCQVCSVPIVFACDAGYAMQLATALRSLIETTRSQLPLDIYVLTDSFQEHIKSKVLGSLPEGSVSLRWITVDLAAFAQFSTLSHITKVTYARLLIPDILPECVERILYLDSDLIVLDDLTPLWRVDLEGAVLGAVMDSADPRLKSGELHINELPEVRNYFNAGVLLIDLRRWREERISEMALEYLTYHPNTPYSDQDALNIACDGIWKPLGDRWNFQCDYSTRISDIKTEPWPGIVHFVTHLKPWIAGARNVNAIFYDSFRSRTKFARGIGERCADRAIVVWLRSRTFLGRSHFIRTVWSHVRLKRSAFTKER